MKKIIPLFAIIVFGMLLISACSSQSQNYRNGDKAEADDNNKDSAGKPATAQAQPPDLSSSQNAPAGDAAVKEFKMTAKQFVFEPDTIEVNKGDKVRLIVTSTDVAHGITIPQYGINEKLAPGKPVTIEFMADREGTFEAFCSVFCGAGHQKMKGKIIVK